MVTELRFRFVWVPSFLGGHKGEPYEGMRTAIRWQRHIDEFLRCARDVQWEKVDYDHQSSQGEATCRLTSAEPLPDEWVKDGELIELLNGFRVLAVGKMMVDK